uniref:Uncharacterized protein n=1 Tax=Anguilla anguilla TaxID=7936 RepID=A0A0E9UXQ7_ANGAN
MATILSIHPLAGDVCVLRPWGLLLFHQAQPVIA